MEKGWERIYTSDKIHLVEIVKAVLLENGIQSFMVDKKDSTYITIGEIELYVKNKDVVLSKFLIDKNKL
jgi:hypothetical protein